MQNNNDFEVLASVDSEKAVIGSCMIDPDAIFDVKHILTPQHFSLGIHKHIYNAICLLADAGEPVDLITVSNLLDRKGVKEVKNSPIVAYLMDFANVVPTSINVKSYAKQVKHDSVRRSLVDAAGKINTMARKGGVDTDKLIAEATATLESVDGSGESELSTAKDAAIEFVNDLESDKPIGIRTGFVDLDRCIGGLEGGNSYWVCAAEKMGKTSFANAISLHNALDGKVVLRISAEMGKKQRTRRDISYMTGIPIQRLKRKQLTAEEWNIALTAAGKLSEVQMIYDDSRGVKPSGIAQSIRNTILKYGRIDLLEVDYFQLLESDVKNSNRVSELETISRNLEAIIGEYDVPMIMMAQVLSKSIEQRADKRPMASDIFGSSAPMKDAYFMSFLYRDEHYNKETESPGEAELITRLHRDGDTPTIPLVWQGECAAFRNKSYADPNF